MSEEPSQTFYGFGEPNEDSCDYTNAQILLRPSATPQPSPDDTSPADSQTPPQATQDNDALAATGITTSAIIVGAGVAIALWRRYA